MKKFLWLALVFSVVMNLYFVARDVEILSGGGQYEASPTEALTVNLSSLRNLNRLSQKRGVYAQITVYGTYGSQNVLQRIIIYPINAKFEGHYRLLKNSIEWSPDESQFKVSTPDFTITVNMQSEPGASLNSESLRFSP